MTEIRDFMSMCKSNNIQFVMCITKDKLDPIHNLLKFFESKYGVLTQHIWCDNVRKCIENPNRKMTLINIIMKSNLKFGGVNYDLRTSQAFSRANPRINYDIVYVNYLCLCYVEKNLEKKNGYATHECLLGLSSLMLLHKHYMSVKLIFHVVSRL